MSRPYRILVQKVVEQEVTAGDRSTLRLKLDPVLPPERLAEVLGEVLQRNGWERTADGAYEKDRGDGENLTCDVATGEVTAVIELETQVRQTVHKEIRGDTWNWRQMREMTDQELDDVRQREEEKLTAEVTAHQRDEAESALREEVRRRLDEGADERRREVNRVVLEVMGEALKEKAAELGQVQRVDEHWDGEAYELTIAVKD